MLNTLQARAAIRKHTAIAGKSINQMWTDSPEGYMQPATGNERIVTAMIEHMSTNSTGHAVVDAIAESINKEFGAKTARVTGYGYLKITASYE